MKYVVYALREYTRSEHEATTHELKQAEQGAMQCSESRVKIHNRDLEGSRKPRERGGKHAAGPRGGVGEASLSTGPVRM